jgi:hypothetical protein
MKSGHSVGKIRFPEINIRSARHNGPKSGAAISSQFDPKQKFVAMRSLPYWRAKFSFAAIATESMLRNTGNGKFCRLLYSSCSNIWHPLNSSPEWGG